MKKRLIVPLFLSVILLSNFSFISAQEEKSGERIVPEIQACRANPHAPSIDGFLDDPIWESAKKFGVNDFTQSEPDEGKNATESTLVAVAYDDEALYVAFWCFHSEPDSAPVQVLITVSKKHIKKASKRNEVKRKVREAYRLNKHLLTDVSTEAGSSLAIALIYTEHTVPESKDVRKKIIRVLQRLNTEISQ